jgi:hypothetical protein
VWHPTGTSTPTGGHQGTPLALPTGTSSFSLGVPAIQPTQKGLPTFTRDEVIAFLKKNGVAHVINGKTNFTVVRIDFISSKEASNRLHGESIGVPDQAQVCYVELAGSFVFPGPDNTSGKFPRAIEIFDAQTGNLLLSGGLSG